MPKYINDTVYNAALSHIQSNAAYLRYFDVYSTDYATINTNKLAEVAVVSGDFTLANGDVSGRKLTTAAKNSVAVTATGNINHVACVSATSEVLYICEVTTKAVANGDSINMPAHDNEIQDVTQ